MRTLSRAAVGTTSTRPVSQSLLDEMARNRAFAVSKSGIDRVSTASHDSKSASPGLRGYPHGRDRVMLPWPVLEVDCPTWGGMSGGPVFDEHGHLIGLLCSSFSVEEGGIVLWT